MEERYTLSVRVALPGTPLMKEDGVTQQRTDDKKQELKTSSAGHMWYSVSNGSTSTSYGFAPKEDNWISAVGPGSVDTKDDITYHKPYYTRTMEITKEQYEQLKEYGESAIINNNSNFNTYYVGTSNSCVDFTWKALNSAGIEHAKDSDYEGRLKPKKNIENIKSIVAPFPESELNKEESNPKPKQTLGQKFLTENGHTDGLNNEMTLETMLANELNIPKNELQDLATSKELRQDVSNVYNEQIALQNKNEQTNADNNHVEMHRQS